MKTIPLSKGQEAIVDEDDYPWISRLKWYLANTGYVVHSASSGGKSVTLLLHRFIMQAERSQIVDHINGYPLDNRRANLRIATRSQNSQNARSRTPTPGLSFRGVRHRASSGAYEAQIQSGGKRLSLGVFRDPFLAAQAYDEKARELFGENAMTNEKMLQEALASLQLAKMKATR